MPELNRRNVLIGMGGLAIGGGALLGSGAFTTVNAERDVEVNVLTDNEIGDSDQFADILIDVGGYDTVAVDDGSENLNTDGSGLFPEADEYDGADGGPFGEEYVSLLQNDVTIVFGYDENAHAGNDDQRLLPNTTTNYADLIALVNTNTEETGGNHELEFDNDDFSEGTEVEFEDEAPAGTVGSETAEEFAVDVSSGDDDDTGGVLEITITEAE